MADLGPVGQHERIADDPSCTSDFPSNELLEDGIKKRVATLAAQHVALGAGVQQNGLALALRSVRERRFDNQTRELLAVLHPRKTVARLSGCASRGRR